MNLVATTTIEQAIQHIQALPVQKQQSIFDYIDLVMLDYQIKNQESQVNNSSKRQFGLYQGKGSFKLSDDWQMSEEELFLIH
ncbi:hypothetical protein [Moraxella oblonga]|uniref:hypothetical protein n=1 Tax=Moraxella oblonga TaxID=200413 RepID=UPI000831DE76|nr:hypothetical protein [Moraxella oblonga]